jgi:hypothetical protein
MRCQLATCYTLHMMLGYVIKSEVVGCAYIESTHGGVLPAIERMQTRQVFAEVEIAFIAKLRQRGRGSERNRGLGTTC